MGPDPEAALTQEVDARTPDPAMIDYYGQLLPEPTGASRWATR